MRNELLNGAASAAEFTGMSRRQIYRLVEEGQLPCTRKGRRLFFLKADLLRAFQSNVPRRAIDQRTVQINGMSVRVSTELGSRSARCVYGGG